MVFRRNTVARDSVQTIATPSRENVTVCEVECQGGRPPVPLVRGTVPLIRPNRARSPHANPTSRPVHTSHRPWRPGIEAASGCPPRPGDHLAPWRPHRPPALEPP